jgi:hypothetical protein
MNEDQNSLIHCQGAKSVQAPESRRSKTEGMMGADEGNVGGFPADRSSLRAFWREPRVRVER